MSISFNSTPNPGNPVATQSLFPNWLLNPIGSEYAADRGYDTTMHIQRDVFESIVDSIPAEFAIFPLMFSKPVVKRPLDEFTWTERLWPRPLLTANAGVGGGATQTIVLTAGGVGGVVVNDQIVYEDNTHGIVTVVNMGANSITVIPLNGAPNLPAVVAGDTFTIHNAPIADGMATPIHFDRMTTVAYTNYISLGKRNKRWTTMTALKYKNAGTTDYFEKDAREINELSMQDMFAMFINGVKGEATITPIAGTGLTAGSFNGKTNWGLFPFMQANGAQHATSTPATIEADFETLAFSTNYQTPNSPRIILGSPRALYAVSKYLKDPIRFSPNDRIFDLNLYEYKFGEMRFVPMSCPLFERRSNLFPPSFENRLIILDPNKIDYVCMEGYEPMAMGNTGSMHVSQGGYNDFIDYWLQYMVSMMMHTVDGSFWIDLTNL